MEIVSLLSKGKENAIHMEELANILGVSTYTVKTLVKKARLEGELICSDADGYYIASNKGEADATVKTFKQQSKSHFACTSALEKSINNTVWEDK